MVDPRWRIVRVIGIGFTVSGAVLMLLLVPPFCVFSLLWLPLRSYPILMLSTAVLLLAAGVVMLTAHALHSDTYADLHCTSCGYDLRARPGTDRCPECGALRSRTRR